MQNEKKIALSPITPFPEMHDYIIDKLKGGNDCIGEKGSYLKVFQSALHYYKNGKTKVKQKRRLFEGSLVAHWFYFFMLFVKTLFVRKKISAEFIMLDPGRVDSEGDSIFFSKIVKKIPEDKFLVLLYKRQPKSKKEIRIDDWERIFVFPGKKFLMQLLDLRMCYQKAKISSKWSDEELHYLDSCMHSFLTRYSKCLGSYDPKKVRKVFFVVHYLNEGFISAMKDMNIQTIELQHGLISLIDLYYCYDDRYKPWINNMFLPDNLFVFGKLWRERLLKGVEWDPERVKIMGDYTTLFSEPIDKDYVKSNILLICVQKRLSKEYLKWIVRLKKHLDNHRDWRAIVKLHPYEDKNDIPKYESLAAQNIEVIQSGSMHELFSISKIQVSVYSTTFYDSIGYQIMNYSLIKTNTYDAYVEEIIDAQMAVGIEMDEDPIQRYLNEGFENIIADKSIIYDEWKESEFEVFLKESK
jgi:hypothetical protein